jgi:hypothetical protein
MIAPLLSARTATGVGEPGLDYEESVDTADWAAMGSSGVSGVSAGFPADPFGQQKTLR